MNICLWVTVTATVMDNWFTEKASASPSVHETLFKSSNYMTWKTKPEPHPHTQWSQVESLQKQGETELWALHISGLQRTWWTTYICGGQWCRQNACEKQTTVLYEPVGGILVILQVYLRVDTKQTNPLHESVGEIQFAIGGFSLLTSARALHRVFELRTIWWLDTSQLLSDLRSSRPACTHAWWAKCKASIH